MERQRLNVDRMRLLGAEVIGVDAGSRTLKDAINEAMRDWVTNVRTIALPARLRARRASVSANRARLSEKSSAKRRARRSCRPKAGCRIISSHASAAGRMRSACFDAFLGDAAVKMVGVEAGGRGNALGEHAARLAAAARIHGRAARSACRERTPTSCKQPTDRSPPTHSISAGLDYPASWPGARMARGRRPRGVHGRKRRGCHRSRPHARAQGRHHSRARVGACSGELDRRVRPK